MQFIFTIFMVFFVGLLLAGALSFSFIILIWFAGVALAASAVVLLRQVYYRWRFLHNANRQTPGVIDVEFKDISDK